MNLIKKIGAVAIAFTAGVGTANAGVVFSEDWTGATPGLVTVPGGTVTTTAHTWSTSEDLDGSAITPPELTIIDNGGNLILENTDEGDDKDNESILTVSGIGPIDSSKAITVQFDISDQNDAGSSQQRWYVLLQNSTSEDGYRVRVSTENNDEEVLNASVYDDGSEVGDEKWDDMNNGSGDFGVPGAGEWRATVTFIPRGADTELRYRMDGLNATADLLAEGTDTFTGASVQDSFDEVRLFSRRSLASIDNIVVTEDTDAPVITVLGDATVNLNCGDSYTDAGATANDAIEGDLTAEITTVNPVNTNVPGTYTVTYDVSDVSGNAATQGSRTVIVANNCATITIDPVGDLVQTIEAGTGNPAVFEVNATGSGTLTYQWFFDDGSKAPTPISGAESASYTILSPQESDSGTYYVQVSDDFDTAQSPNFTLTVVAALPASSALGLVLMVMFAAVCGATLLRNREAI